MRVCVLDGREIKDRETLHEVLAEALKLPDWYGRNLDALFDCLTEVQEETYVQILQEEELDMHLGSYGEALKKVLQRAAEENPRMNWAAKQKITGPGPYKSAE